MFTALSFPVGVAAATYLEEYAPRGRLTNFVNVNIRNLSGVPSVVFGILGLTVFVETLRSVTGGRTLISAGITISLLVLPIVIITSAEAIRAVPATLREGAFGLGATRWEVIRTQVLPYARPGRAHRHGAQPRPGPRRGRPAAARSARWASACPTATASSTRRSSARRSRRCPSPSPTGPSEPLNSGFFQLSAAAIVVMLFIVLVANSAAIVLRNRFERKRG